MFSPPQPQSPENIWRSQLDQFVKSHQQELAALSWGLWLENGDSQGTIGINLKPTPNFVYCPIDAIEKFNERAENRLQEILGLIKHYKPETEVLMIAIGKDQIKLVYFEPQPAPPVCFEQVGKDVDTLMDEIELGLSQVLSD
jgi:hypothetical protein